MKSRKIITGGITKLDTLYYLAFVKIRSRANITKPFYSDGTLTLEAFKNLVNERMKPLTTLAKPNDPYEVDIYEFEMLIDIKKFLLIFFMNYKDMKDVEVPAPKIATAKSVIPEDIRSFEIDWN